MCLQMKNSLSFLLLILWFYLLVLSTTDQLQQQVEANGDQFRPDEASTLGYSASARFRRNAGHIGGVGEWHAHLDSYSVPGSGRHHSNLAFALEPPALIEYSNSTGTVIACKPFSPPTLKTNGHAHPVTPISVNWRVLTTQNSVIRNDDSESELKNIHLNLPEQETWEQVQTQTNTLSKQSSPLPARFVRADGALVLAPFAGAQYQKELHSATYRCCLENSLGSLCSGQVRTLAVLDSHFELEVFDEFALAGNSIALKCHPTPTYLTKHLEFTTWLKDDKIITSNTNQQAQLQLQQSDNRIQHQVNSIEQQRRVMTNPAGRFNLHTQEQLKQQRNYLQPNHVAEPKYLMLKSGELIIRNITKFDSGSYKCRARHKLTQLTVTSRIGAQLMVDESRSKSDLRLIYPLPTSDRLSPTNDASNSNDINKARVVYARENSDTLFCAIIQSVPVPKFTWWFIPDRTNGTATNIKSSNFYNEANARLLNSEENPEIRQIDSCLLIQQVQLNKHLGQYLCEASNNQQESRFSGVPSLRVRFNLLIGSSSLSAHLSLMQANQQQSQPQTPVKSSTWTQAGAGDLQLISNKVANPQQIVQLGSSVYLNCSISGFPYDSIAWFKDSKLMLTSSFTPATTTKQPNVARDTPLFTLVQPNVILIDNFQLKHRGIYQCQVFNNINSSNLFYKHHHPQINQWLDSFTEAQLERDRLRSASGSIQLDVAFARPQLNVKFPSQNAQRGSDLSLQCSASGVPTARIFWFLDGYLIWPERKESTTVDQADTTTTTNYEEEFFHYLLIELQQQQQTDDIMKSWPPQLSTIAHNEIIKDNRFQVREQILHQPPSLLSTLNVSGQLLSSQETGMYKCVAINSLGSSQHSAQVNVLGFSTVQMRTYQPTNVTLIAGESATLQCPLVGYPLNRVDWFHNDQRLPANHRQRILPVVASSGGGGGGQLELNNVDKLADGGVYTCRATTLQSSSANNSTLVESDDYDDLVGQVRVIVKMAPLIDSQSLPELVQANEGQRTKLVCSILQGDHPVTISWLKRVSDQTKLAQVGRAQLAGFELLAQQQHQDDQASISILNLDDSSLLTFKQLTYSDSAEYLCFAQNEVSQVSRLTRVVVNVAPSWSTEPASELSVLLGDRLELECGAFGYPNPTIVWKREYQAKLGENGLKQANKSEQQTSVSGPVTDFGQVMLNYRQRVHLNGSLIIDQVELQDSGSFMCEVSNGIGIGLSKIVQIHVNVPPYFKFRSSSQLAQVGGRVELKCVAYGDQPMIIGWRKDTSLGDDVVDLVNDSRHRLVSEHKLTAQAYESILSIDNVQRNHSGGYLCIASNEFGSEHTRIQLIVQEAPEAPLLLRPIRASSRQATLSFKPPYSGNSLIRKYSIAFKPVESLEELNQHVQQSSVMSTNQQKDLVNWQQVLVDAPSMSGGGGGGPTSGQADNLGHLFQARPTNESSETELGVDLQHLVSLNLCCLQPYTKYLVRVRAINEVGQSEPSRVVQFSTDEEAIGGPPLDVGVEATGAHSLKVRWRAPNKQLQNGLIRGYYIGYRAFGTIHHSSSNVESLSTASTLSAQTSPGTKLFEVSEGEQYQYKNVQLDSSLPTINGFLQQQRIPGSESLGHQQDIQDYLLGQTLSGQQTRNQDQTGFNSSQRLTSGLQRPQILSSYLTNLRRKTTYSIIVQAYNKIGAGPRSDQITVSTLDAAPPMSPLLRLAGATYNSAQFVWSSRKFSLQRAAGKSGDNSTRNANQFRVFTPDLQANVGSGNVEQVGAEDEEENSDDDDDDPQSYYTLNYKVDDKLGQLTGSGTGAHQLHDSPEWQQRRIQGKQQMPFVLSNLKCGSHHLAFMTATNSLGQSEPGETIKFTTLGAAPIAPQSARDFLQVNSSYVLLRLSSWQNAGCLINSFSIKYKTLNQAKWTILEHQVHPTMQTVTITGNAVFSARPLDGATGGGGSDNPVVISGSDELVAGSSDSSGFAWNHVESAQMMTVANRQQVTRFSGLIVNKHQKINDFVIRNLASSSTYRLIVETNSEAGSTQAEYEFETGNFTSTTISIVVNGISAAELIKSLSGLAGRDQGRSGLRVNHDLENAEVAFTGGDELDFNYNAGLASHGGPARALGGFGQRFGLGVWSLTALFVVGSVFMAATTLVLGFRSLMRMRAGGGSKSHDNILSAMLCCSSSSSSASSSGSGSHSSSGAGTCYQVTDAYCSAASADGGQLHLPNILHHQHQLQHPQLDLDTPTHFVNARGSMNSATISGNHVVDSTCNPNSEIKSMLAQDNSHPFRHLTPSASLSMIGSNQRYSNQATLFRRNNHNITMPSNGCNVQTMNRRFSNDIDQHQVHAFNYAATLGNNKQHSTFISGSQQQQQPPSGAAIYNNSDSPLYGRLQKQAANIHQPAPANFHLGDSNISSGGGTSGYETSNSMKLDALSVSGIMAQGSTEDPNYHQSIYLQQQQRQHQQHQTSVDAYQMNMYATMAPPQAAAMAESNLFENSRQAAVAAAYGLVSNRDTHDAGKQGPFEYNIDGCSNLENDKNQQELEQLTAATYGMVFNHTMVDQHQQLNN